MGLFVRRLNAAGLQALEVMELRVLVGLALAGVYLALFHRERLRVRVRDLWCFFGTGVCSLLFFSWCYFTGMSMASLSVMGVLLYTAPAFVMLMSALLFRERLSTAKLIALAMTFAGCCLVSGLGGGTRLSGGQARGGISGARLLLCVTTEGLVFNWFRQVAVLIAYSWFVRRVRRWRQPRWDAAERMKVEG